MSAQNRAALLSKTFKVLNKHFKSVAPPGDRSVLEHLMYASCLQNSKHEHVDDVLAKLQESFYDWNEVRVTTRAELAEVMSVLSDPNDSAARLKRTLHSVFETYYSFDLEFLRKQNLAKSVKDLQALNGTTEFTIAYLTQNALGGHSIPVNRGVLGLFVVLDVISQSEARKWRVPGLERAVSKSQGVEFASLLHQFGVDFANTPFSPRVRSLLLDIDPDAKERLPKRTAKKESPTKKGKPERPRKDKKAEPKTETGKAKPIKKTSAAEKKKKKSPTKRLSRKKPR